jgi:UDP-N-acetylmuramoyl-L-alanyl-D-glutamate--2,6-diaminopimelate ligase
MLGRCAPEEIAPMPSLESLLASYQSIDATLACWPQGVSPQQGSKQVTQVGTDSRQLKHGSVFVALQGSHTDGHRYVEQAIKQGAIALVLQQERAEELRGTLTPYLSQMDVYTVANTYKAFGWLNAYLQQLPGEALGMVGVTGTNGKTTVTHLIESILKATGKTVGLIGTLGARTAKAGDAYASTGHTTPMADELQQRLADMRTEGIEWVTMEVSSHALEQYRVAGCAYRCAVYTNLTQDHLDYHKTMEAYFKAKAKLFEQLHPLADGTQPAAVLNLDDAYAGRFAQVVPTGVTCWGYGLEGQTLTDAALEKVQHRVMAFNLTYGVDGASYQVKTPQGEFSVRLKMAGQFSVYNSLAAFAAGLSLGIDPAICVASLEASSGVRGRFELVSKQPYVIVDYAHTPDGLENVLQAARKVLPEQGQLRVVFGCGGDRDSTKRPKMGAIAEQLADTLYVTSDNPRSEAPQQIIADILAGVAQLAPERVKVEPDRRLAIRQALNEAALHDIVVVAGKGHEDYQILADRVIHFDDREEVQLYLKEKASISSAS